MREEQVGEFAEGVHTLSSSILVLDLVPFALVNA